MGGSSFDSLAPSTNLNRFASLVTHSGPFHADDVLAAAILLTLNPDADLLRTRDPKALAEAKAAPNVVMFDVGFEFDEANSVYDHHQREGKPRPRDNGVPYSSAGLIWQEFGNDFVVESLQGLVTPWVSGISKKVWQSVDEVLIQGIDAIDNGDLTQPTVTLKSNPETKVHTRSFSGLISGFNPAPGLGKQTEARFLEAFLKAVGFAKQVLVNAVRTSAAFHMAKAAVTGAVASGIDTGIVVLDQFLPWQEHLFAAETSLNSEGAVKFVVFPQGDEGEPTVMVQQVPTKPGAFEGRIPLPAAWAGLRNEELDEVTGIPGGVFVHNGRFIGGHTTRDGAVQMAEAAIASATANPTNAEIE